MIDPYCTCKDTLCDACKAEGRSPMVDLNKTVGTIRKISFLCTCPYAHSDQIPCYGYMDRDHSMTDEESDVWMKKAIAENDFIQATIAMLKKQTMSFNEYQKQAQATDKYPEASYKVYMEIEGLGGDTAIPLESIDHLALLMYTLGLSGEAGEVSDKIKKVFRDKGGAFTPEDALGIAKELGDNLWYLSAIAKTLGYTLEQIAELNIGKLKAREANKTIHGAGDNR